MPPETTIGLLNAQMRADISDFNKNMDTAAFAAKGFSDQMTAAGLKFSEAGVRLSATNKLAQEFSGALDKRRAEEFAVAVEKIGGAAALTAADQARVNKVVADAVQHYQRLGQEAPAHLVALEKATRQVESSTESFGSSLAKNFTNLGPQMASTAAGMVTGLFTVQALQGGFRMLTDFVGDCIESFEKQEVASKHVEAALRSQGTFTPELAKQYDQLATHMESVTVNADELNSEAIALFVSLGQVGPAQMGKAMQAAADLSAGLGIDLLQAVEMISKGLNGSSEKLKKLTGDFEDSTDKGRKLENMMAAIEKRFGGRAAAEIETTSGQIKQLGNSWDNLKESIGQYIVTEPHVVTAIQLINAALKTNEESADAAAAAYNRYLASYMQRTGKAPQATGQGGTAAFHQDVLIAEPAPPPDRTAALRAEREKLLAQIKAVNAATREEIIANEHLGMSVDDMAKKLGLEKDVVTGVLKAHQDQKEALRESEAAMKKAEEAAKKLKESEEKLAEAQAKWHSEVIRGTVPVTTMIKSIGGVTTAFNAAHVAAQAFAQAHRELSTDVNDAVFQLVRDGASAQDVFTKLKAGNQAFDDQKESIENLAAAYKRWRDELEKGTKTAPEMIASIGHVRTALDATQVAAQDLAEKQRQLSPATKAAAEDMLAEGRSAEYVFNALKAKGIATDADKVRIEELAKGHQTLGDSVASLANTFVQLAQVSGSGWGAMAQGIGTVVVAVNGAFKAMKALEGTTGFSAEKLAGLAAGWIGVAVAAYQVGTAIAKNVQMGHQFANVGLDIANEMGALIKANQALTTTPVVSSGLATQIANEAEELKKLDKTLTSATARHYAELLNLDAIIKEQGGLTAENLDGWIRQSERLFEVIKRGGQLGQKAIDELNKLAGQFADQAAKTGGLWSEAFKKLIADAKAAGVELDAVNDAIKAQQSTLAGAVTGVTAATGAQAARYTELKGKVDEAKKALADLIEKGAEQEDIAAATEKVTKAQADLATVTVTSQEEFDRLSRISLAAFNGLVASGVDVVTAMNEVGPGIDNLIASAQAFGLSGNAAFDQLSRWRDLTKNNEPLLQQIGSLNDVMVTLQNLGGMTVETFNDLEKQGGAAFDKLTAAGFTENEALVQMKPFLENVLKLSKERGFAIDNNTAKLIAQATEQGILDDKQLSTNDLLMEGFKALLEGLGIKIPEAWKKATDAAEKSAKDSKDALDKTGEAGENAAHTTESAWNRVRIVVPVKFDVPDLPSGGGGGGGAGPSPPAQSAAYEGFFKTPTTVRVGDDPFSEGEFVLHKRTVAGLVAAAAGAATQGRADLSSVLASLPAPVAFPPAEVLASSAPPVLSTVGSVPTRGGGGTVIVTIDRRFLAQMVVPELEGEVRRLGFGGKS